MKNTTLLLALLIFTGFFLSCGNKNTGTATANPDSLQATTVDSTAVPEHDDRFSPDFELFVAAFLNSSFWGNNIDSMVHASSPVTNQFMHKDFPFGRYWNEGVFCLIYHGDELGYHFGSDYHGEVQPQNKNYPFFKDKTPNDGFCDAATSPDGLYYQAITNFPKFQDPASEGDPNRDVVIPTQFKSAPKMALKILVDHYIIKSIYFVQIDKVWYLAFFDDCDCSA